MLYQDHRVTLTRDLTKGRVTTEDERVIIELGRGEQLSLTRDEVRHILGDIPSRWPLREGANV